MTLAVAECYFSNVLLKHLIAPSQCPWAAIELSTFQQIHSCLNCSS